MARPIKNNCDYFSHDAGMRNHRKVKALRNKFTNGYAIWCMLLEYLTGIDGNEFEYSDMEFELMSGDFGVSVTEIRDVVNYCISLEMLFNKNGFISSESLDLRLAHVYEKRQKAKELSAKQRRKNGSFCNSNAEQPLITVAEKPESKVNEIEVKKSKEREVPEWQVFLTYAKEKKPQVDPKILKLKYDAWIENKWKTGKDKPIKNWKSTLLQTLPHLPEIPKDTWGN